MTINRREWLKAMGMGAVTAAWPAPRRTWAADALAGKRVNLLFIMTDQQRFDALGCAGNPA
ncbi:MAG: hypothetical protein NTW86_19165, partial [Candidatus Sumerlaeota bacterium]|nr:hypothetical protein [Candidatus Sumerlaeota bacterium]